MQLLKHAKFQTQQPSPSAAPAGMRRSIFAILLLSAFLPVSAQAGKYADIVLERVPAPPGLYETLPEDDPCQPALGGIHYGWLLHQASLESPHEVGMSDDYTREEKWQEASGHAPAGSAVWALSRFEVMLIWDKKLTLRETEQAMLKKCRSIPPKAQQFPETDYGLK